MVQETQTGFIKGRFIGENTRLIYDIIDRTAEENISGLLMLLDFEKAFDSIEWQFIEKTMAFFNFGQSIIKWFKILYNDISSCVQNNGHLSPFFSH